MASEVVEKVNIDVTGAIENLKKLDGGIGKSVSALEKLVTKVGEAGAESATTGGKFLQTATKMAVLGTAILAGIAIFKKLYDTVRKVATAGFDFLMSKFVQYEVILLKIKALTDATSESLLQLSDDIREIAKASVFTSLEIGNAAQALSKMGVEAINQSGVLQMVTATAIGTQEDLIKVARLATKIMNMFMLQTSDMVRINDVMAKAVSGSALDMQMLGDGLQYVGATGASVGLTLEQTSAHLALLTDRGQKTNRAGRMLSNIYTEMADEGSKFNKFLKFNGVHLDTVQEKMMWLSKSDIDATTANAVFTKSVARMAVVMGTTGGDIEDMTLKLEEAEGASKRMEQIQLKGLSSGWKIVKSLVTDTRIAIGGFLRPLGEAVIMGGKFNKFITKGTQLSGGLQETFRVINVIFRTILVNMQAFTGEMDIATFFIDTLFVTFNSILKVVGTIAIALVMAWKTATAGVELFATVAINALSTLAKVGAAMWNSIWNGVSFKDNMKYALSESINIAKIQLSELGDAYVDSIKAGAKGIEELYVGKAPLKVKVEVVPEDSGNGGVWLIPPDDPKKKKPPKNDVEKLKVWNVDVAHTGDTFWEQMMGITPDMDDMSTRWETMLAGQLAFGSQFVNAAMSIANTVSDIRKIAFDRDMKLLDKKEKSELRSMKLSASAKHTITSRYDKKREAMRKVQAEKDRKLSIANALVNLGMGVAGIWANSFIAFKNPIVAATMAGISTALLVGTTTAQIAKSKAQSFAGGGVVDGFVGATTGADNRTANVRGGEMLLNAEQQRELFEIAKGRGGSNRTSIYIGNYTGNDEGLANLEEMLNALEAGGRFVFGR